MLKKNNFLKLYLFIIILFVISIISHFQWFELGSVLTFSDWGYWSSEAMKQLYNSWGTWLDFWNLGNVNIQIPFLFFNTIWSFLAKIGFSYDFATKFTFFIPISILGFISPYLLVKKLIKDNLISFTSALFYGSTTYFLVLQTAHLTIALVYSIVPLILLFFIKCLDENKLHLWILFSLFYSIGIYYEVRIMYIATFLLLSYFIYFHFFQLRKFFRRFLFSGSIILLLNLFWLMPVILGGTFHQIEEVANRSLFGESIANINYAFTIFHWSWTGSFPDQTFTPQSIIAYFWIIPFIIFIPLIFKKNEYKKNMVFFLIVSLLGIFLVKQSSNPFSYTYNFLFKYLPGFNLFRESSKFYLLIAIGYLGFLAYGLQVIKENGRNSKKIYFLLISLIMIISLLNLYPIVNGSMRTLFVSRSEPKDYRKVDNFISREKEYSRSLWFPVYSRWSYFENNHPEISSIDVISTAWNNFIKNKRNDKVTEAELVIDLLTFSHSSNLLNQSSIKYIIIPLEDKANDDDFFVNYGKPRLFYINELSKIKYLHRINIGTKEIVVYENSNYKPHIYLTNEKETIKENIEYKTINYKFINPAQYTFSIKNVSNPFYLNFSESYHPDWKIHIGSFNWWNVLTNKNYFISDKYHFQNDATLNSFYINPEVVCNIHNLESNKVECVRNADGSYDISGTLYFKPQSYMYLGLIISGSTLIFVLCFLSFIFGKHVYGRNKK